MILGIGNDIIEVARIKASIERYQAHFLDRLFTPYEQKYCFGRKDYFIHFAGRFAAKEAVSKALGTGFCGNLTWLDIEIRNDEKGKPSALFSPEAASHFQDPKILLSISHCRTYATAVAIWILEAEGIKHA